MRGFALLVLLLCLCGLTPALAGETPSAPGSEVYIVNMKDGQTVVSPFKVIFGLKGMGVAPAGVVHDNTGHHHLLVDTELTPEAMAQGIPLDEQHLHFGKGQTETMLTLPPGNHQLRLVFADANHVPHNPVLMSKPITIIVTPNK